MFEVLYAQGEHQARDGEDDQRRDGLRDVVEAGRLEDEVETWLDDGGMTKERVNTNLDILVNDLQLLDERPKTKDVADFSIANKALKELGEA